VSRSIDVSLMDVVATLALVAVAVAVSLWQRAGLEGDIGVSIFRSFVQLTAIGYVIKLIFQQDNLGLVFTLIAVMVLFGALTARGRARGVPGAFLPLLAALALAGGSTLLLVVALGVFKAEARYLVPVGGMVVGNSMTAAAVALNRLGDEVRSSNRQIEATLALGATATQAMLPVIRRSLRSAMIPLIDSTKTTGLIFFPGTMVGMLLAGAQPIDAVRLQLILLYTLLGSVSLAALFATTLAHRNFFTPAHQLRDLPEVEPRAGLAPLRRFTRRGLARQPDLEERGGLTRPWRWRQ
jgi:putative ABC transport system permease protein